MKTKYTFLMALGVALAALVLAGADSAAEAPSASAAPQAELHVCLSGCVYTDVQSAIDAANPGDVIKIAEGHYTGVLTREGLRQMAYITKTLTLQGGYTTDDWQNADPVNHPTWLDAESGGRVLYIAGAIEVRVEGLQITGGNAHGLGTSIQDWGGGVYIQDATVAISRSVIAHNVAVIAKNKSGGGGGLYALSAHVTLRDNVIRDNLANGGSSIGGKGGGLYIVYGTAHLENNQIVNNRAGNPGLGEAAGAEISLTTWATLRNNLISGNVCRGVAGGVRIRKANATLIGNQIVNNTADSGGGVLCEGVCTLTSNLIAHNVAGDGSGVTTVYVQGTVRMLTLENNAIIDNHVIGGQGHGSGLALHGHSAVLRHNTFARNSGGLGTAIYATDDGSAQFTNTLISDSTIGVYVEKSSQFNVVLDHTLWSSVLTPTVNEGKGTLSDLSPLFGPSGFAPDGYHLSTYSAALERGLEIGLGSDIDGEARPLPIGTLPDIGADENAYSPGEEFVAEKAAFAPQWAVNPANPAGRLLQRYLLRFHYGSPEPSPPPLTVTFTDSLPLGLVYDSAYHNLDMNFVQQGQLLTWQTAAPVARGQTGEIELDTYYDRPPAGLVLTNRAGLRAGPFAFDLEAVTQVPVVAPLIATPGSGELCAGTIPLRGMAQPGVTVTVYANGSVLAQLPTDDDGLFGMNYDFPGGAVTLKAIACASNGACSPDSNLVELTLTQSFWCPQRSTWRRGGTVYRFRDGTGKFSTRNWAIPGFWGFQNTLLELYVCNCPNSSEPPDSVWVTADGFTYNTFNKEPPWYRFNIGQAHDVTFYAQCGVGGTPPIGSHGVVLIDPDGYVFDVTQGFDPVSPTLHSLAGVTVTAYVSMPTWGGWVPWPAHLYDNQINPQVTGEDGYFAFFTPPGDYYLQVEGKPGYQSWRSPVIHVVNEIVHVNVPLTPQSTGGARIALTPDGPTPAVVTIAPGDSVEWQATLDVAIADLMDWIDNPTLRPLSARNPLSDTLGFDGGMLAPGRVYRRQFTTPGTYTYSDGLGHTATIVVAGAQKKLYLPLVVRR